MKNEQNFSMCMECLHECVCCVCNNHETVDLDTAYELVEVQKYKYEECSDQGEK